MKGPARPPARESAARIPDIGAMGDRLGAAALLVLSNVFMTAAWYGHLRFKRAPLLLAIFASWGIALFEYLLQVPANRIGYRVMSAYQLKVMQEAITLVAFMAFAAFWLGDAAAVPRLVRAHLPRRRGGVPLSGGRPGETDRPPWFGPPPLVRPHGHDSQLPWPFGLAPGSTVIWSFNLS